MGTHTLELHPDPDHVAEVLTTGYTIRYNDPTGHAEIESMRHTDDEIRSLLEAVTWRPRPARDPGPPPTQIEQDVAAGQARADALERLELARENLDWHEEALEWIDLVAASTSGPVSEAEQVVAEAAETLAAFPSGTDSSARKRALRALRAAAHDLQIHQEKRTVSQQAAAAYRAEHLADARARVQKLEAELDELLN